MKTLARNDYNYLQSILEILKTINFEISYGIADIDIENNIHSIGMIETNRLYKP